MKQKIKVTTAKLFNHLHKVKKRHVEKFMHTRAHTHHAMIHMGELVVVGMIGFSSLLFANYNNSYEHLHRNNTQEIVQSLTKAMEQAKPKTTDSKIISIWEMDGNVNNTFAPGYCTYGAARISPEFFPYSEDKMTQERTRGGNAIDRCENAEKTGFKIGSNPAIGALIVYKKIGNSTTFGHVGKVMYYNKSNQSLIVREMNWLGKFIMTDRREKTDNENIKCYIYPGKTNSNTEETSSEINIPINTGGNNQSTGTVPNITSPQTPIINNTKPTQPEETIHNSAPTQPEPTLPVKEEIITPQEPENNTIYETTNEEILIQSNENFSDISKHFFSQYEMKITIIKDSKVTVGKNILVKITIINKETKEPYVGILPFILNTISQNSALEGSLETVQFIHNEENNIIFKAKEKGSSTILLTIDDQKIVTIPVIIQ